jgi:hypothetical protein
MNKILPIHFFRIIVAVFLWVQPTCLAGGCEIMQAGCEV